jgi:hypothetical protein
MPMTSPDVIESMTHRRRKRNLSSYKHAGQLARTAGASSTMSGALHPRSGYTVSTAQEWSKRLLASAPRSSQCPSPFL